MKKHATTILLFVVMFVGLGLLLYPSIADWWNSFHQSRAIAAYTNTVEMESGTDYTEYWEAARAYNERLAKQNIVARLSTAGQADDEYGKLLMVGESQILGIIEIPEIAVQLPLYHGTSEMVLQVAVGHLHGTSLPTGGGGTHCAFSAHRGLPSAKLFTNLDQLDLGDTFTLRVLDRVLTYEIDQIVVVLPHQVESLEIDEGMDYCSLITCTPYGVNSHRLIVRGHRVENSTAALMARVKGDATEIDPLIVTPIVAAPMLIVLLVIMLVNTSPKKKKKAAMKRFSTEEIVEAAETLHLNADVDNEEGGERP